MYLSLIIFFVGKGKPQGRKSRKSDKPAEAKGRQDARGFQAGDKDPPGAPFGRQEGAHATQAPLCGLD